MMKKKMLVVCAAVFCLSLAACGGEKMAETTDTLVLSQTEAASEQVVEITMENWEQYFELKNAAEPVISEAGDLESWDFSYGVFLKEEYLDRFVSGQVDFEILFDTERRKAGIEEATGTYELGELIPGRLESDTRQKTFGLEDFRDRQGLSVMSDYYGSVAGQACCGSIRESEAGELTAEVPVNGQILHAEGTLTILQ